MLSVGTLFFSELAILIITTPYFYIQLLKTSSVAKHLDSALTTVNEKKAFQERQKNRYDRKRICSRFFRVPTRLYSSWNRRSILQPETRNKQNFLFSCFIRIHLLIRTGYDVGI